jgi:hypothetical protein
MGRGELRVRELKDALVCVDCGWTNSVASLCRVQTVQAGRQVVRMWLGVMGHGRQSEAIRGKGSQAKSGPVRPSQAQSGPGRVERQQPGVKP